MSYRTRRTGSSVRLERVNSLVAEPLHQLAADCPSSNLGRSTSLASYCRLGTLCQLRPSDMRRKTVRSAARSLQGRGRHSMEEALEAEAYHEQMDYVERVIDELETEKPPAGNCL